MTAAEKGIVENRSSKIVDLPKKRLQFGLWPSPISAIDLTSGTGLTNVAWDQDGSLVWLEQRGERGVLVVQPGDGQARRDLNSSFSVRGKVGYGGGEFCVGRGQVYFVEASSGRIYRQGLAGGLAQLVTPAFGQCAAPALSPDGRWLLFIRSYEGTDTLEVVDTLGQFWPQKLVEGDDFYMQPVWHPDGRRIAFVSWNAPNMPWDGCLLEMGVLEFPAKGLPYLAESWVVSGDEQTAVFQPEFSPDGRWLAYISDPTGWGHLYLKDLERQETRQITRDEAEHGMPAWVQGQRRYAFSPDGKWIFFVKSQVGFESLWQVGLPDGKPKRVLLDDLYTSFDQISAIPAGTETVGQGLAMIASGGRAPGRIIACSSSGEVRIIGRSGSEEVPAEMYAIPQAFKWQGQDGGLAHGLFYPPTSVQFEGVGLPPLIVHVHGGPTSQARASFDPKVQYFTTRGYAVLEVNHRGSTGYGRAYQDALLGNWGIYDVQDSVSGARALVEAGWVDGSRLVIYGGSAGGFTVLKALVDYPGFFKSGICLYGIANQFTALDTHKFEAHYSDRLLGPLPEAAEIYRQRSPLFFADRIKDPVALFHGAEDRVVPPAQSDEIAEALRQHGVPYIYHLYPGEGHGFRKAETIEHFLHSVEAFLRQYVIFSA